MFKKFTVGILIFLCGASNAKDVWIPVNDKMLLGYEPPEMFWMWLLIKQPIRYTVWQNAETYIRTLSEDLTPDDKKKKYDNSYTDK